MNMKQQQLTFDKGMTNVPSDIVCDDNTFANSVGMVYADGEHRVIQKPVVKTSFIVDDHGDDFPADVKIKYVHKFGGEERYIGIFDYESVHNVIYFVKVDDTLVMQAELQTKLGDVKLSSIGKTLIVSDDNGIHYYIWHNDGYDAYTDIPIPDIDFCLGESNTSWRTEEVDWERTNGILTNEGYIRSGQQEAWNNLIVGLYTKNLNLANKHCVFVGPFFVLAAVKLYDGTYVKSTNPILMVPSMTDQTEGEWKENDDGDVGDWLKLNTYACKLKYHLYTDYSALSDIVENVTIFVSKQVETLDIINDIPSYDVCFDEGNTWDVKSVYNDSGIIKRMVRTLTMVRDAYSSLHIPQNYYHNARIPQSRTEQAINDDIESLSLFYKLTDIGKEPTPANTLIDVDTVAKENALVNLETNERLVDGYYEHTQLNPGYIYVYNSRLNLANTQRTFFEGFTKFFPYDRTSSGSKLERVITAYVTIETGTKTYTIPNVYSTYEKQGQWFFYPDSRARHVSLWIGHDCILDEDLKEHEGLNGAYYFRGLPFDANYHESIVSGVVEPTDVPSTTQSEQLANTIITSEANNPFTFMAEGYNNVGFGSVIAITTITQALSQGQFGQYPLLVFSTDGIWAMSVDDTGLYQSTHPMSREVCTNADSIVQTDNAVYFVSEKGLMATAGSDVRCVSDLLSGKKDPFVATQYMDFALLLSFKDFLNGCFIAYDYRDSLLWIFKTGIRTCYVYSIKSGAFSKYTFDVVVSSVVNNYPDYLLQSGTKIMSLLDRPEINSTTEQTNNYPAALLTRPLKLENGLALKSIMQIKHIMDIKGTMTMKIWGSNDASHWVELTSLTGSPWKYYRFRYDFSNLKATDRFDGSVLITQERRTNKLR